MGELFQTASAYSFASMYVQTSAVNSLDVEMVNEVQRLVLIRPFRDGLEQLLDRNGKMMELLRRKWKLLAEKGRQDPNTNTDILVKEWAMAEKHFANPQQRSTSADGDAAGK